MKNLAITEAWQNSSKCRNENLDTVLFFDEFEKLDSEHRAIFLAETCYSCAAATPCLEAAKQRKEESGLFGGQYFVGGKAKNPLRVLHSEPKRDRMHSTINIKDTVSIAS